MEKPFCHWFLRRKRRKKSVTDKRGKEREGENSSKRSSPSIRVRKKKRREGNLTFFRRGGKRGEKGKRGKTPSRIKKKFLS